jgi:LuxR family transcriptional regulator, maltose regulon positive regulatory protein
MAESKIRPPPDRTGSEPRKALVDRLLASPDVPVISVVAPPGYGKTTLLAQWASELGRTGHRVAWLSVDRGDKDPAVLLTGIAAALDVLEPVDPVRLRAPAAGDPAAATVAGRRVAAALSEMAEPTTLVLDHTDALDDSLGRDTVAEIAAHLPSRSQLAVAARDEPPLPTALLRARREIVEIDADDLAMDEHEASTLLEAADVRLACADIAELVRRTEGWPVGLYFAALALKAGSSGGRRGFPFRGDDRLMADYLRSELLSHLSPETVSFLTRTSVLDSMCGPLCDAVAGMTGSSQRLESLERSNLLMVPLDRRREWYRYHHLFQDLLRSELVRLEPRMVPALHVRAAAWCEANGHPEVAIEHAQAAGDADRVARLVLERTYPTYVSGRVDTCRRWLHWFEDEGLVEHHQPIAVLGALVHTLAGDPAAAELWAASAERGSYEGTLPDGSSIDGWLALLRAFLCREGMPQMRRDAQAARDGLAPASPWRPNAFLLEGISYLLEGEPDEADPILTQAFDAATHTGGMPAASVALTERAIVSLDRGDWTAAETLTDHALAIVRSSQLDDHGSNALPERPGPPPARPRVPRALGRHRRPGRPP